MTINDHLSGDCTLRVHTWRLSCKFHHVYSGCCFCVKLGKVATLIWGLTSVRTSLKVGMREKVCGSDHIYRGKWLQLKYKFLNTQRFSLLTKLDKCYTNIYTMTACPVIIIKLFLPKANAAVDYARVKQGNNQLQHWLREKIFYDIFIIFIIFIIPQQSPIWPSNTIDPMISGLMCLCCSMFGI